MVSILGGSIVWVMYVLPVRVPVFECDERYDILLLQRI